jgi:hypothetical protein
MAMATRNAAESYLTQAYELSPECARFYVMEAKARGCAVSWQWGFIVRYDSTSNEWSAA